MAIYGNSYIITFNSNALFEQDIDTYINDLFLEGCLNESVGSIQRAIENLSKKEEITKDDINNIYNDIKFEEDKTLKTKKTALFITSSLSNIIGFLDFLSLFNKIPLPAFMITKKWKIASTLATVMLKGFNFLLVNDIDTDAYYKKLIFVEAKCKVQLHKLDKDRKKAIDSGRSKEYIDVIETNIHRVEKMIMIISGIKDARREYLAKTSSSYHEDTDLLLEEFKGNEFENAKFETVLSDIDRVCKANIDRVNMIHGYITKMESYVKSKSVKDKEKNIESLSDKLDTDLKKVTDSYAPLAFRLLKQESKSLNNKLSSTSLASKEQLKKKLDKYTVILNDKLDEINDTESRISRLIDSTIKDRDVASKVHRIISNNEGIYRHELNLTKQDIAKVYDIIGVDKQKNSILYKLLNGKKK